MRTLARSCTKCDTAEVVKVAFIGASALAVTLLSAGPPAWAGTTPAQAGRTAGLAAADAPRLPPPRHSGTLRVTGALRDGGAVRAAGLSWRPPRLPRGDRLLSFAVAYYWHACPGQGTCTVAADTTATPFAARRYVAGHADTGRRLRITETATEVVQTSRATFSFIVKSASVSRTTNG